MRTPGYQYSIFVLAVCIFSQGWFATATTNCWFAPASAKNASLCEELYRKGRFYFYQKDYQSAESLFNKAYQSDGPEECKAKCLAALGEIRYQNQNYSQAIPLLEKALKGYEQCLWPDHPYALFCKHLLAESYLDTAQPLKAEGIVKQLLKVETLMYGKQDKRIFELQELLVRSYVSTGKYYLAYRTWEAMTYRRPADAGKYQQYLNEKRDYMITSSVRFKKWHEVEPLLTTLPINYSSLTEEQILSLSSSILKYSNHLFRMGKYPNALRFARRGIEILESRPSFPIKDKQKARALSIIDCQTIIGRSYMKLKEFDPASKTFTIVIQKIQDYQRLYPGDLKAVKKRLDDAQKMKAEISKLKGRRAARAKT